MSKLTDRIHNEVLAALMEYAGPEKLEEIMKSVQVEPEGDEEWKEAYDALVRTHKKLESSWRNLWRYLYEHTSTNVLTFSNLHDLAEIFKVIQPSISNPEGRDFPVWVTGDYSAEVNTESPGHDAIKTKALEYLREKL